MIREKMFRLHRHKSSTKDGERIDFIFYNIQALQVPKGWDKLYVSLLSTKTRKTVNKSGKAFARNGTCQWTETLSESVFISHDEAPKEFQHYTVKLVVGMGSARSSILGEATINLAGYMSSRASIPVSLPLKKCNHGTTLQAEIQCLTPTIKCRDEISNHSNSYAEDANSNFDDVENKSEVSDCTFTKSVGSSSSNHLDGTSHPGNLGSRETSFSESGSRYSFDSVEGSLGRESISSQNSISGIVKHVVRRHDDSGSGMHRISGKLLHGTITSPLRNSSSSGNFLESEVITMEEFGAEARMWERNARKLMHDHEVVMKEFADKSKQLETLQVELSASLRECEGLKQEIVHLKVLLEKSTDKQKTVENFKFQPTDFGGIQKVLEDELKFQKESNHDMALQLKKTQESNLELVSILQEMEETIENKKEETLKSNCDDAGNKPSFGHEDNGEHSVAGLCAEFEQAGNWNSQLQQLRESQMNLESTILYLEKALEEKNHEIVIEQNLRTQTLQDCETQWRCKFTEKERKIVNLEENLSKATPRDDLNLSKEIESLNQKVQELERDCNELTDENLELLLKLKESTKNPPTNSAYSRSLPNEYPRNSSPVASEIEVSEFKYQIRQFEEDEKDEEIPVQGVATKFGNYESQTAVKFELLPELRATEESLIEKCSSLEKSNRELRLQKIELQEYCMVLEVELEELRSRFSDYSKKIESLEAKFSGIVKETNSKEKILNSELDALYQQDKECETRVDDDGFLNQICLDKSSRVQNLLDFQGDSKLRQNRLEIIQVINHEKLLGLLEGVRSNEKNLRDTIDKFESKLKSSEHERLELAEEISSLKTQLQKIPQLQDEVLALEGSLYATKFENERLKMTLDLLSRDLEELKTERINVVQRIASTQTVTSELENCRRNNVILEENFLRMEVDLTASEALCSQESEVKNELEQIRRMNSQFQWKIKEVEEEKQEWLQKAKALEEELRQKQNVAKQEQNNNEPSNNAASSPKIAVDTVTRIAYLENELADALEANDMYKVQLKSLLSKAQTDHEATNKEHQNADFLEAELKEIRERYLKMSLRYAEVESQREQLVMKLKTINSDKNWFS